MQFAVVSLIMLRFLAIGSILPDNFSLFGPKFSGKHLVIVLYLVLVTKSNKFGQHMRKFLLAESSSTNFCPPKKGFSFIGKIFRDSQDKIITIPGSPEA